MDAAYALAPLAGYVAGGTLKFALNGARVGARAFERIGYGGLPSTHTTIVTTTTALIGMREGIATPAFAVSLTLALIVVLDAVDLRRRLESHAIALNRLAAGTSAGPPLRERLGHRPLEILAGIVTGCACAWLLAHVR
jgi:acid phosphatase family membrane protein YuiD